MSDQTQRQTLHIAGMHCSSCALAIDMELEDLPGVAEARTSYARAMTEVIFNPARVSLDAVIAAIRQVGYTAQPVARERG